MWTVVFGNLDIVQMLLDAGADPNSKHKNGPTPLSLAAENGFTAIIEALLKNNRHLTVELVLVPSRHTCDAIPRHMKTQGRWFEVSRIQHTFGS